MIIKPFYDRDGITIYCGDCLEVMPQLPDSGFGLIFVDWPYYKVKGESWDRQWENPDKFLEWIGKTLEQAHRLLAPNGSFYGCASPHMATRVEMKISEYFNVLNNIRWEHHGNTAKRADRTQLRGYLSFWESVIFAEHYGIGKFIKCNELYGSIFDPLRQWFQEEKRRAGLNNKEINAGLGVASNGGGNAAYYFGASPRWGLPTQKHYQKLQELFNANCNGSGPQYLRREYEDLRREYEDLRREYEDLRRPFNSSQDTPHTDLWDFKPVSDYPGKHPTQKPLAMLEHIVRISSRPDMKVLDFTMGSGTTLVAAQNEGRQAVGIDTSESYCKMAISRLKQKSFFSLPQMSNNGKTNGKQLPLIPEGESR